MPAQTTHHVGGTKHFECKVKGHPRPEIRWYKDNKEITHLPRYKFDHSQEGVISMVIPDITLYDEGHYRCRAENSEGFASTSAYLFVRVHKEHLEEATTSFHTMQIEESVLFTESEKASRTATKTKVSEPFFETSIEEISGDYFRKSRGGDYSRETDINGDYSKGKELSLDKNGVSEDNLKENGSRKDNLKEKNSLKTKTHLQEDVYRKSVENVVKTSTSTTTITSRSKQEIEIAEQESNKIKADMLEKSYHSSDDSNDEVDAVKLSMVSEKSVTSGNESHPENFDEDRSSLLMRQTRRLFSHDFGEETDLLQKASSTTLDTTATTTKTTSVTTTEMSTKTKSLKVEMSTSSVQSSSEETRQETVKSGKLEASKTVTTSAAAASHTTAIENNEVASQLATPSQTKLEALEAGVTVSTTSTSISQKAGKSVVKVEETSSGSVSSSRLELSETIMSAEETSLKKLGKGESETGSSSIQDGSDLVSSQIPSIKMDASNNVQAEATRKVTSDLQSKEAIQSRSDEADKGRTAKGNKENAANGSEENAAKLNNEKLRGVSGTAETEKQKTFARKEEEDFESGSESDGGSSVESVVDVDLEVVNTQKLRKQESKEKDEAGEEPKPSSSTKTARSETNKEDINKKDDVEKDDVEKDDIGNKRKGFHDNEQKHKEAETKDDGGEGETKTNIGETEKKGKGNDEVEDDAAKRRRRRNENLEDNKKDGGVSEGNLQGQRQDDDDEERRTNEAEQQRMSWISKVEEEKDKEKSKNETTSKEGDKEAVSPRSEPRIVQKMEDVKVDSGKTLKLRTQVQGSPRPNVTWLKDDRALQQGGRVTIFSEDDVYSLEIEEVGDGDAGTYRFRAVNSEGEVFTDVVVNVVSAVPTSLAPGDRQLSLSATVGIPQFLVRPQDISVAESETIKLTCTVTGDPAPKITWQKDGKVLRSNRHVRVYEARGVYNLEIYDCEATDTGGYVCTATNSRGESTATFNVFIEGVESVMSVSGYAETDDLAACADALVGATGGAVESSSDELFLQSYVVLMDYVDEDTKTRFAGGDLVEVLDSRQKSGMWLVRGNVEKDKVCFVPSSLLCIAGDANIEGNKKEEDTDKEEIKEKKRERKTNHSPKLGGPEVDIDTSEDELRLRGVLPDYVAVADYVPPPGDANSVRLSEGQIVEVVDKERPDLWLVKTRPSKTSPSRQGWVPSAYLEEKTASAQLMSRSTRETFREEVLQVTNKQQEASLKRRNPALPASSENPLVYVIKELEETEREYIRDLKVLADNFVAPVTQHPNKVPEVVTSSSEVIFSNIMDILQFHDSKFLADIAECCIQPSAIGSVFLKWKSEFDNYIQFWGDRDPASFLLESEEIKNYFKELSKKSLLSETDIINHLRRPIDRLKMYQLLLRGILRYAARAGEDCSQVQEAIAMLIAIEKAVENSKLLPLLEGFEVASTDVENLIRHDDFIMWEGEGGSSSRKERHVFLFADKIVMTKKKKRQELSADQTYFSFKSSTDLSTVRVRESSSDDDRKFELWFIGDSTLEKVTLQARSATAKQVWVKDIREALIKLGISEPDKMPESIPDQADEDITPSGSGPSSPLLPPTKSPAEEFDFSSQRKDSSKDAEGKTDGINDVTATEDKNPSKPFVTDLPTNVACQEGHPTRIECHLEGYPTPKVTWQKGGKPVQEGATIKISLEGNTTCLIFSEVNKSDSGDYSVKVSNSQGSSSSSFDLVVLEDLVETDTSTDRTNGEVEDTASGSETVVEEEEESHRKLEEDKVGQREKLLIEEKEKQAEEERLVQERKKEETKEAQFVREADEEVVSKVSVEEKQKERRRRERGEDKTSVSEKADTEEKESKGWDLVVGSQGKVNSCEQTSSFSSESSTSRSVLQGKEGEDWAVEVSSQVKQTTNHQRSEFLSITSETFLDGSLVSGTEVTQNSLSFTTDISSSENTPTLSALTAAQQPQPESLSLQSEASVQSSSFRQTESAQNLLSFQTGISNSESVETDFGLISPDQSHSKGLSLESDTSIDSSSYKQSEVTQNLLSFQTDLQNSENVEAVQDITSPRRNDKQKAEFSTQPKTEESKAEVEQVPEAEVSEKEIVAEVKQVSKLQEQQATKLVKASEGFSASTVAEPEQEEQIAFEESFQKEKAEPRNESQDLKLTESTQDLKQKQELKANFEEDISVSNTDTDLQEDSSCKKAFESPEIASLNQVFKPLEAATDVKDSQAVPDSVSAEKPEKNISPETGKISEEPKENQVDTSYNKDKSPSEEIVADFQFEEEEEKVSLFGKRFEEQREENKKAKEKKDEVDTSFNKDKPGKTNQKDQESEELVTDFQFEEEEEKVSLFGKRFEEQREEDRKAKEKKDEVDTSFNKDKPEKANQKDQESEELVTDFQFEEEEEKVSLFGKRFEEQREEDRKAKEKKDEVDTSFNKDKPEKANQKDQESEELVTDFQFEEEEEKVSLFGKRFEEQREEDRKAKEKKDEVDTSFNKDKPEKANQKDQESEELVTDFQFEEEEEKVSLFGKRFEEQREENRKAKEKENNLEKAQDKGVEFNEERKLQREEREQEKTKPEKTVLEEAKEEEIKQEKAKAALEEAKAKQEQAKAVLEEEKAKQEQAKAALEEEKAKQEQAKAALEEEKAKQEQVKAALEEAKEAKVKQEKAKVALEEEKAKQEQVRAALEEAKAKQEKAKAALEEAKEEKAKADLEEANEEKAKQEKLKADLEEAKAKHEKAKAALEEEKAKQEKTKAALEKVQEDKARAALEEEKAKQEKLKAALEEAKQEKAKQEKLKAALEEAKQEKAKQEKLKAALEEAKEEKAKQEQVKAALEEAKEETRADREKDSRASAPRIVGKMDDCVTELGDLARFDCRVSAYPDPEITWFKDGNKVTPSTKYELLNFHDDIFSLLIKKVDLADSGRYTCVAKNEYGEAKSQALLNVMGLKEKITDAHVAPSFVTKFYDMEAIEGVPVEFVCVIDGNPDPIVTWLLNGQEVQNSSEILTRRQEDTVMLAFRSIKVEHSGEVICKLKNDCGQAMCKARLKVKEDLSKRGERPLFLEQPSDKEVTENEEVTFECVISGRPDPEITWYFNGRELHDSKRRTMRSKPGQKYTLTIREVVPEYAGVYTCKAVNRAGDASCAVELSVKELPTDQSLKGKYYDSGLVYDAAKYAFPPSFTRRIQDQRSLPGRSARFEALVIGVPEPQVEWYKDGVPLKWGGKYKMGLEGNNAILVVDNCDLSDEGNYTCTLYNDAGKASSTAQLKVQEDKLRQSLPRFMSPAGGIDLYRISSSPATKKTTLRDIPPEDKIPTIPIDKPVLLDVKPTTTKLSWMPAPTAMLPENAQRITYIIEACQLPSKQWVRLESNIDSTTHYVYGLKPDTEYMFRVKAENRFGTSDPTLPCTLKRREEPKTRESMLRESEIPARPILPKTRPYVSDIGKETVQIGWKPAEIPDYYGRSMSVPPVTYRVEAQKLPSEEWVPLASRVKKPSIYLSDLEPDRDYNIRVRAQTPYGVSQPTEPVWIPRAKAFTGVPVSRPIITEIEEGTARLQWSRVDIPAFNSLDEPLLYMIEMQEPPSSRWRELARRVPINSYIVRDLEPAQDYRFRVRAESRDGLLSEPSPATSLFRTLALSHAPVDRLEVEDYDADLQSARLSWRRVEVPPYGAGESPLLYMIECETPGLEGWRPLVSGIPTTRYRVPDLSPTEDYRFRVRALTAYGMSPPSYPTTLYRRPSPMRPLAHDLHISSLEPESVGLSWRSASVPPYKSSEPISYQIEALEYPKTEWRPLATNIRDTNYRLGGLKPSSDYSFRVRAHTPSGLAEPTAPVNLSSLQVRPRLPVREPSVTELSLDSVRLQWKPAELPYYSRHITPITYTVDYQEVPGRDWVVAARNIPDTSYTFRGLRGDRDYRFRVCPQTEHGPGEYSLPANIHRRAVPTLPTREPMLSNVSPTTATLSWHPATLASGSLSRPITYRIESREPPSSAWYEVASRHPSTSYNLQFLYPDQDYMFRVLADYDGVESEPTMAVFLPRRAGPPKMYRDPPFLSNVQPESVILAWRSVELPSRITDYSPVTYRIEVQEGPTSDWRPWARQVNQTHFHVTKLRPDTDYSFRIRAENEFGISEPTDPILIRKRAVAPLMSQHEPLISDVRPESLRLTWQPAEMPSYLTDSVPVTYTVYSQEEGDHSWQPIARRIAGTSYYVTGLSPDRDYSFRIQAENTFGTSLQSFPSRLHRKLKAPIYSPEIEDVDSTSFRLSWKQPALSRPTTYSVETLEPLTWKWRPLVSRLPHPSYRVTGIQPTADYAFRVRAEVDSVISDPSLPISFSRRRAGDKTEQSSSRSALPTVPVERPTLSEVYDDTVRVNWHPSYYKSSSRKLGPQFYRLEVRELPDTNWHTIVSRTDAWSYEVTDLKPNQDYAFRVRTVTDTGMSEPSLPVYHYRQATTPRVPLPLPEVSDIGDDYIGLRWKLVDIPAFDSDETPLSFMIEAQRVPEYDWRPVARGVTGLSHKVTGLEPKHDYMFRLRGETSIGLTQPSATIPVYRKPVMTGVPITNLRIDPDVNQPYSARLHWNPVYIPSFGSNTTFAYTVEVQEPPRSDWYPVARDVYATSYTVPELSPLKDYLFRIKARLPGGEYSAPTPPIPYYRSPVTAWDRFIPPISPYVADSAPIARPYIEGLILKVPPRMSIEKPDMTVISQESIQLTWKSARVPSATSSLSPTTYRVEVRQEDSFEWIEKATGIKGLTTEVKGLNPYIDYAFRVRAVNDFGWSESTLPAFLHRPQELRDAAAEMEFEEYEIYGSSLSDISVPRMPMDTPRMGLIQDRALSLSWTPARIPAYARKTPITYIVEKKEPVDHDWVPLASRISDTSYTIRSIEPKQDYLFRIRAENEHGLSEATLPAVLTRSKAPQFVRSSTSRERELDSSSRRSSYSYIDTISAGVPPRVPSGRPSISDISDTSLILSWQPGRMPSYIKGPVKISYIVEVRQPPNHMWTKVSESVAGASYQVTGLKPDQDYMFRVRAYNDSGISEPTLPVSLNRDRAPVSEPRTHRRRSSVERFSSIERRASIERSMSVDRGASVPRILSRDSTRRDDEDLLTGKTQEAKLSVPEFVPAGSPGVQYAIDAQPVKLSVQIGGFPLPTVNWYFKGKKLLFGDRYDGYVTPAGVAVLQFGPMTWDDVGEYKCVAENEQGEANFVVRLQISDPPTFLLPIRDLQIEPQGHGQFTCQVDGIPAPTVKFMKDWKPITESSKFKVTQDALDKWSLHIDQATSSVAGCYVCVAENAAGKVFSSARLSVDDDIPAVDDIYYKKTNFEDDYYVLEELGRGRYSTVRRVIQRTTGKEFAAKFTKVRDEADKNFFHLELDALIRQKGRNVQKLHDAYETSQQLILVVNLAEAGDILERATSGDSWTEARAAQLIKLVLLALRDVHSSGFVHLDLKPTNVRFSTLEDNSLQLIDFGFARKLPLTSDLTFNYGTPEFCSPESVSNQTVTTASDLWAVGVLAHLLLTGVSPFYAETTSEILSLTRDCKWNSDAAHLSGLSDAARDFISRLLVREPRDRLSLESSLGHDWLKLAEKTGLPSLDVSRLRAFQERVNAQQKVAAVRTVANLVSLKRLLEGTVSVRGLQPTTDTQTGEVILPDTEEYGQFLDEESWYEWQARHQQGFKSDAALVKPQVKGHRLSVDILAGDTDEDLPSSDKTAGKQASGLRQEDIPPSIEKELEWLDEARKQKLPRDIDEISLASKRSSLASISTEGFPGPLFKEKLHDMAFSEGDNVILRCVVAGPPTPTVVWYKNEELLAEGARIKMSLEADGEATLTIRNAKNYDAAVYKCVGRNKFGRVSNRMRLLQGDVPGRPGQPAVAQVSSTDALILWEAPRSDGNSGILFYRLDHKAAGQDKWLTAAYTTQEAALATGLTHSTFYRFRVSATNRFGTSHYSWASVEASTKPEGTATIASNNFFNVSQLTSSQTSSQPALPTEIDDIIPEGEATKGDSEPTIRSTPLESVYNIGDALYKGRFYEEKVLTLPSDNDKKFILRTVPFVSELREYEVLKSLRHEYILRLYDAYSTTDYIHLVLEYAEGEHIARHLSQRRKYTENTVVSVIRQVLYAIEFLQRFSLVHLNLQPASVVVSKLEGCQVKLTDFSLARKISGPEGDVVPRSGFADFIPPEVVVRDLAGFPADIWGVGALAFLLLSGVSPFHGDSSETTLVNIALNRYEAADLYENISTEALKFIFKVLKRLPRNRLSVQECLDNKWLQLTDLTVKEREDAIFLSNTLATFVSEYDLVRQSEHFRQSFDKDELPVQMSAEKRV